MNDTTPGDLGTIIRTTRQTLGLTVEEFAVRAGTGVELVRRIESGKHHPSTFMQNHLARVVANAITAAQ